MALPEKELADEVKQSLTPTSSVDENPLLLEGNTKGDTSSVALSEMDRCSSSSKKAEVMMPSWGRRKKRGESNGILETLGPAEVVIVADHPGRPWLFVDETPSYIPKKRRSAECPKKNTAGSS